MSDQPSTPKTIFLNALEVPSPEARQAYVVEHCGGDAALAAEVNALLQHHQELGSFLQPPAAHPTASIDTPLLIEVAGTMIGPYKLLEQIGEGGMGVVFMAEQQEPVRRKVAVKLIKPGMDTRQVIARFEAERQALAVMDHPSIARVLDGGTTPSGHPYFVMELVRGVPITTYCDENNLPVRERLELFASLCQAIQHAHTKGIIHRDIKPTNVLVTRQDGRPVVKVIDFGVAKAMGQQLTEKTLFTNFAQMIGTPLYMSPEQAEQSGVDIDTRSDIYSLGVLLYELLTGSTPVNAEQLKQAAFDEIRRIIREDEPPTPNARISGSHTLPAIAAHRHVEPARLTKLVRGELDWIVMKALEKDRNRRYETANAFSVDLLHYLNDEPVQACPPSVRYRFGKFARRNRVAITTASLVAMALVVGTIVSTWQALRAEMARVAEAEQHTVAEAARSAEAEQRKIADDQRTEAQKQRDETLRSLYFANVRLAHQDWNVGHLSRMTATLDALRPRKDAPDLRGWEWHYLASLHRQQKDVFHPQLGSIGHVRWSPAGRLVAISGRLGVKIYEPASQQVVHFLPDAAHGIWSSDGSRLATVSPSQDKVAIKVWNTHSWQELFALPASIEPIYAITWKPDGHALAWTGGVNRGRFFVWEEGQSEPISFEIDAIRGFDSMHYRVAWGPDGRLLAMGAAFPGSLVTWDRIEQKVRRIIETGGRGITFIAWSPDGTQVATTSFDGSIGLRNVESGELIHSFVAHNGQTSQCAWSADGTRLVSGGEDNLVRIWSAETAQQLNRLPGHRANVRTVDWSPKEDRIVSGSSDGTVRFWRPNESQDALLIPGRYTVAWSPNGKQIVSNDARHEDGETYSILDARTFEIVRPLQMAFHGSMTVFAWSPDGKMIAGTSGGHNSAQVWDATTGRLLHTIVDAHVSQPGDADETRCVAWSRDSRQFATCGLDRLIKIWEAASGKLLHTLSDHTTALGSVCWSPDGRWLASADWHRGIKIRAADTWQVQWETASKPPLVGAGAGGDYTIAWSPDSRHLTAVSGSGQIVVWKLLDAKKIEESWSVEAHTSVIRSVAWSPDGKRIASGSEDRTAKIWDAKTGDELLTLGGHNSLVCAVVWSPDGRQLISAEERTLRLWDATEAYEAADLVGINKQKGD